MRRRFAVLLPIFALAAVSACSANGGTERDLQDTSTAPEAGPDPQLLQAGETLFFQCIACHTTAKNEPHLQGPNLWGIFGAEAGTRAGFPYSQALLESEVVWNEETMEKWLEKPAEYIPGNMMAFVGLAQEGDRDALIAYLRSATSEQ